ncbi:MAG: SdpI family protein [Flavobacteriaceae bacterium]|nr:SdpI family protein [Flavobacteriaceae bacterium]
MDFTNDLFLISGTLGFISIITGFILLKFPPKNINFLYGYRTKSSMKSKERWDFAQSYSAKLMIKGGVLYLGLGVLGLFLNLSHIPNVSIGIGTLLLGCIYLIVKTELKLKQKFESNETI